MPTTTAKLRAVTALSKRLWERCNRTDTDAQYDAAYAVLRRADALTATLRRRYETELDRDTPPPWTGRRTPASTPERANGLAVDAYPLLRNGW